MLQNHFNPPIAISKRTNARRQQL